jgi:hypothetical protein
MVRGDQFGFRFRLGQGVDSLLCRVLEHAKRVIRVDVIADVVVDDGRGGRVGQGSDCSHLVGSRQDILCTADVDSSKDVGLLRHGFGAGDVENGFGFGLLKNALDVSSPPVGITPNFIDPPSKGREIMILDGIFTGLMLLAVLVRLMVRARITRQWGWDDCQFWNSLSCIC